ncbi:MAG TPA: O-antigen ligase family protein [Stellaceae bacterium]|nr:O-antigen ligase family protein [Stellaceae bacterium]
MTDARAGPGSAAILAGCAAVLPLLAEWAPLGLAPLLAVAGIAVLAVDGRAALAAARHLAPCAVLFGALALWAAVSAAWSILPLYSFVSALRLVGVGAGGLVVFGAAMALAPERRRLVGAALLGGLAAAIAVALIERATDGAITRFLIAPARVSLVRFDRGATTLALALWPMVAAIAPGRRAVLPIAVALAGVVAIFLLDSDAASLAVVVGIAVFAVAWAAPRLAAAALAAGLVLAAIALPLATPDDPAVVAIHHAAPWIKYSGIHRLMIWRFTADRIAERPLLGWGMGASRDLPGGKTDLTTLFPDAGLMPGSEALPLHPHSAVLQWEVELGVPGTLAALAFVCWSLWRVGTSAGMSRLHRAASLAWAAAAMVIALLAYGIWQSWWLSCLWLTAALFAAITVPAAETPRDSVRIRARDQP